MSKRKAYQDEYHLKLRRAEIRARRSMQARIDRIVARDLQADKMHPRWDNFLDEKRRLKGHKVG